MKKFTLAHESPSHFILHNGKSFFHVAKNGIDTPTADRIRALAKGGKIPVQDPSLINNDPADNELPEKEYGIINRDPNQKFKQEDGSSNVYRTPEARPEDKSKYYELSEGGKVQSPEEAGIEAEEKTRRAQMKQSPEEKQIELQGKPASDQIDYMRYNNPQKYANGGGVKQEEEDDSAFGKLQKAITEGFSPPKPSPTPTRDEQYQLTREKAHKDFSGNYADGGDVQESTLSKLGSAIKEGFSPSSPAPAPTRDEQYAKQRAQNSKNFQGGYSEGGPVTHHVDGKYHFHFYDGANTPLDKETVNLAEGTPQGSVGDQAAVQLSAKDIDPNNVVDLKSIPEQPEIVSAAPPAVSPAVESMPVVVPKDQQISAAPKTVAPTPDQKSGLLGEFDKSLGLQKEGIEGTAQAQSAGQDAAAELIGKQVIQQEKQQADYAKHAEQLTAQNEQLFNGVKDFKVNPDNFWTNRTTPGKIASTISVLLGGIASGISGGANPGIALLNKHVQEDIEAQKSDNTNKTNLYKIGLEKYRDAQSAQQFATLQSNALLQGQLAKQAAITGSATAKATANQLIGQLGVQNAGIRSDLSIKQSAIDAMNESPNRQAVGGINPNKMRLLIAGGIIPKEEVPQAMKEYGDYNKMNEHLDNIDKVFKDANKDANYTQRISESIPLGSHIPTIRSSTKNYLAETSALLDKLTKDLTGRVTPQSMENLKHAMPVAGDPPEVQSRKLSTIKDIMKEGYSFPTLQSYKLLSPSDSSAMLDATRQKKFSEGPAK